MSKKDPRVKVQGGNLIARGKVANTGHLNVI